jgi:hypothetical protein
VSSAVGGAGLGANDEADQNFLNPATLVQLKSMSVGYLYSDGYRAKDEHDRVYGITVADDSEDVSFAGGFTYLNRRRTFKSFNTINETYIEADIAGTVYKHLSWGLGIFHLRQDALGDELYKQTDARLGLFLNPSANLGIGLIANNIGATHDDVVLPLRLKDELGLGAYYIFMKEFRLRADVYRQTQYNPGGKMRFGGGFESMIDAFFVVRAGYLQDDLLDRKYYTLGFGFTGPRLKIDYSYQQNIDDSFAGMHSVDFRMPL